QRPDAARRDTDANRDPGRGGGGPEPGGQRRGGAEQAPEPCGVEIDRAAADVLHPRRVGECHLEERGVSGRLVRREETGDTHHWLSIQSRVQLPVLPPSEKAWKRERAMEISERSPASRVSG